MNEDLNCFVGCYFEELFVGIVICYCIIWMVIELDNIFFIMFIMNLQLLYFDFDFVSKIEFGQLLFNLMMMFVLMVGISVYEFSLGIFVVNLGLIDVIFFKFVFYGDMLWVELEIIEVCESKSCVGQGFVIVEYCIYNQCGELVVQCKWIMLFYKWFDIDI